MGYHGKLASQGVTTNEEIRGKFGYGSVNPHDDGCGGNCKAFWYGGISRVYNTGPYDIKAAVARNEPNIFIIEPKSFKSK